MRMKKKVSEREWEREGGEMKLQNLRSVIMSAHSAKKYEVENLKIWEMIIILVSWGPVRSSKRF